MLTRRSFVLSAPASFVAAPALAKMMPIAATPPGYIPPNPREREEFKNFFNESKSDLGGCCGIADGFKEGFTYTLWVWSSGYRGGHYEDVVALKEVDQRPDGYWVKVYDTYQAKYVWLLAGENTFVKRPNPTGYYVVWTYYPESICTVRCFAPLAQA
jgi:hypothetical protein